MAILIRKDAWKLSAISTWEPTLLWYAKAVGEMSTRPASDPTSWRFQGAIHGYSPSTDPFSGASPLPKKAVQTKFWKKCQHGCWFFLPWHRMYLGFFEQIVRATVVSLGGPADWALPYWNYSDASNPKARSLPPAFRQSTLPGGSPNPLFQIQGAQIPRDSGVAAGNVSAIPAPDVDLSTCLGETFFSPTTASTVGDVGFGGPAKGFRHEAHGLGGQVEFEPHNAIHVDVGGQTGGWMIDPDTAALDPIFWLHHANIDRLWAVWNGISTANADPNTPVNVSGHKITWATSIKFAFNNATGGNVSMTPSQVVGTKTSPFTYDYDDTSDPRPPHISAAIAPASRTIMKPQAIPEMIGATTKKIALTGSAHSTSFKIIAPSGPAKARARAAAAPPLGKTFLQIEQVTSKESHTTYEVFLNLPERPDAAVYREHRAGALHLFGVRHASRRSAEHSGTGLSFSLDITRLEAALKATGDWDDKSIRVTFLPRGPEGEVDTSVAKHDPIKIGRVSLYRA